MVDEEKLELTNRLLLEMVQNQKENFAKATLPHCAA